MKDLSFLEEDLKYRFTDRNVLLEALTHSTFANENPGSGQHNERLEFLGDAVLGLLTARLLVDLLPGGSEGELSQRRARVVRREGLVAFADQLGLSGYLRVGEGQKKSGVSASILADAYEAVVGAVFMDGGLPAVHATYADLFANALANADVGGDFKTHLQELCHKLKLSSPRYEIIDQTGPDHARHYICEVRVGDAVLGRGEGASKKVAEQACAREALGKLQQS